VTNGQAMNEELEDEMMHRTEGALMAAGDGALGFGWLRYADDYAMEMHDRRRRSGEG
jgi:hypothetical protein